jgi:tRNA (mo5U34)-methyltransferase
LGRRDGGGPGVQAIAEGPLGDLRSIQWYHSIPLGTIVTPGFCPLSVERWTAAALPEDLRGKAVLDVGAWDGYFSFEAERRGAESVLAIDVLQGRDAAGGTAGFQFARARLGSRVDFRVMDVMDLATLQRTFDVVLFLGVYYHLADPVGALRLLFDHLRPGGVLVMEGLVMPGSEAKLHRLQPEELEPTTFCVPTIPWLIATLGHTGFESAQVVRGSWRIRDAMHYYRDAIRFIPARVAFAVANRVAWGIHLTRIPVARRVRTYSSGRKAARMKMYRILIRALKRQ